MRKMYTKSQIDKIAKSSGNATSGKVLMANGSGGSTWGTVAGGSSIYRHEFTSGSNKIHIYSTYSTKSTYDSTYGGWTFGTAATSIIGIEYYDNNEGQWFTCIYNSASSGNIKYIYRIVYSSAATTPALTALVISSSWTAADPVKL